MARYTISQPSMSSLILYIDRLAVLPEYRGRGFSKFCLRSILQEVTRTISYIPITEIHFTVNNSSPIAQKLVEQGFQINSIPSEPSAENISDIDIFDRSASSLVQRTTIYVRASFNGDIQGVATRCGI